MQSKHTSAAAAILSAVLLTPTGAAGQDVLDWPLLLEARPAPLVAGSGATLGNPAGLADLDGRAEALVSDLETPEAMGLRALSIAAGARLFDVVGIGIAYRHVGVGDMLRTDGPPLGAGTPHGTPTLEVAEDVYALGAGARIRDIAVGGSLRLNSPSRQLGGESSLAGTFGAAFQPQLPLGELRFAAAVGFEGEDQRFSGAIEAGAPLLFDRRLALALAWGTETRGALHAGEWQGTPLGTTHRIVLSGAWTGDAELQLGASAQPNASDGAEWVPIVAGLVHLGRYHVGIVREHLPNGFGAAMHYRLSVSF